MTEHAMTDEQIKVLKLSLCRLISQGNLLLDEAAQESESREKREAVKAIQNDIETAKECLAFFEPEDIETQHVKALAKVLWDMAGMYASGIITGEALAAGAEALEETCKKKPLDRELEDLQAWCVVQSNRFAKVGEPGPARHWSRRAEAIGDTILAARKWIDAIED